MINLSAALEFDSIVNGEGLRTVIWTQGCLHQCFGCHNPTTHSMQPCLRVNVSDVIAEIDASLWYDVTFSGGDPMLQAEACAQIAQHIKSKNGSVWCYTGYTYAQLSEHDDPKIQLFLRYIDVLVDGPYIESFKTTARFIGSSNQNILHL